MNNVSRIENANRYDIKRVSPSREHGALWELVRLRCVSQMEAEYKQRLDLTEFLIEFFNGALKSRLYGIQPAFNNLNDEDYETVNSIITRLVIEKKLHEKFVEDNGGCDSGPRDYDRVITTEELESLYDISDTVCSISCGYLTMYGSAEFGGGLK